MLAVSVGHTRHSHKTISECGEFVLVFPGPDQGKAALFCGSVSGRDHDKFAESGLSPLKAKKVGAPLVAGAAANFECRVAHAYETGDHTIFVGEVLASHVEDGVNARLYNIGDGKLVGIAPKKPG
jgi:flavin reductase (DIM6/NTAB) family NADH-FMN oxidoreductase RutF